MIEILHCDPRLRGRGVLKGAGRSALITRWLKFNGVGAIGILVQLTALTTLVRLFNLEIVIATGLAVETAIIHNFVWHHSWTWADRRGCRSSGGTREALGALLRFNLTTGLVSLLGNMLLMPLLVSAGDIGLIKANLMTIATCSLLNFVLSDRFVFLKRQ